jgi:hypothetical protein
MTQVPVFTPVPGSFLVRRLAPGSALVATELDEQRSLVYFEGNTHGASNVVTYADRVRRAAERMVDQASTCARMTVSTSELMRVGTFDSDRGVVELLGDNAASVLAAWLGLRGEPLSPELVGSGVVEAGQLAAGGKAQEVTFIDDEVPLFTWREWWLLEPVTGDDPATLISRARENWFGWEPQDIRLAYVEGIGAQWIVASLTSSIQGVATGTLATGRGGFGVTSVELQMRDTAVLKGPRARVLVERLAPPIGVLATRCATVTIVAPAWRLGDEAGESQQVTHNAQAVLLSLIGHGVTAAYPAWRAPGHVWAPSGAYVVSQTVDAAPGLQVGIPVPLHDRQVPITW